MSVRIGQSQKQRAVSLLKYIKNHPPTCPCHGCTSQKAQIGAANIIRGFSQQKHQNPSTDYAFEMAASNIRYGPGVTKEVGMDFKNMGVDRVAVFTDPNVLKLKPMSQTIEALESQGVKYDIYSDVIVEPKDYGVQDAITWAREKNAQAYLAVGGGSAIDYAKIANLFQVYGEADLMDFVNAPVGAGKPITKQLNPLIAVPTTAGTGSETTGTAIFDLVSQKSKTGIASRMLKPTLGIVDPLNTVTMPKSVKASSGLDVLCHALESYTAIPYNERSPRPEDPKLRPAYQGANPISDVFSLAALEMCIKYLPRSVHDPEDYEAQENMILAATLAGVGFGNAGVHLCHGMSYPLSSQNPGYQHYQYDVGHPIIPHGVSVAVTSPAVFKFTAASNPERHLQAAKLFGVDTSNAKLESAGELLSEALKDFLYNKLGDQPKGISDFGFNASQIDSLVKGALPQRRVLNLAPSVHHADEGIMHECLHNIFTESLKF